MNATADEIAYRPARELGDLINLAGAAMREANAAKPVFRIDAHQGLTGSPTCVIM